jgi:glutaconate CoA-transferase, subunit A
MKPAHELEEKLMTVEEAVRRFVPDGAQVTLGGFTVNRNPMALCREIIRQGKQDLHLVVHSHGQGLDLMIGAGCVRRVELAYGGVARFAPTGIRFKKAASAGRIEVEDYSNYQMTLRFLAGAMGMPFVATTSGLHTDLVRKEGFSSESRGQGKVARHKLKVIPDPLDDSGRDVVVLPPLTPDVALLHAQYVGQDGTVRIKGLKFADLEEAKAADHVIVTCEEIVPTEYLRMDPDQNSLPPFLVDAVVHVPFGAHPTACHLFYDYDPAHLNLCKKMFSEDILFQQYLNEYVYDVPTQQAYLEKIGASSLVAIKANTILGYAPGLDRR